MRVFSVSKNLGLRPNPAAFLKESGAKKFYVKLRFAEEFRQLLAEFLPLGKRGFPL